MTANESWITQGRQEHGRFGNGTAGRAQTVDGRRGNVAVAKPTWARRYGWAAARRAAGISTGTLSGYPGSAQGGVTPSQTMERGQTHAPFIHIQSERDGVPPRGLRGLRELQSRANPNPTPDSRPLTAADLGIDPTKLRQLDGTFTIKGQDATVSIRMLEGVEGSPFNPFTALPRLMDLARSSGATSLTIDATLANDRLLELLVKRYGARTVGGGERLVFPLYEK